MECPGAGDFGEGGGIADTEEPTSDSGTLGRISWDVNDQCESFVFEFETSEGAPATSVPSIRIDHMETFQVIRIKMDVDGTVLADQLVETGLVTRLFVVKSLESGYFVDLHLKEPAAVRARIDSSPARLTVDLRPGLVPFFGSATVGEQVVLVSPPDKAEVEAQTNLIGYSRTFESNVLIVVSRDDAVLFETSTSSAGYIETWGEFRNLISLPVGESSVFVGEASPEGGSLTGITVTLTVR